MDQYVPSKRLSLKSHPLYNEKWVQQLISSDPSILGLGEVIVKDIERLQPKAGRLDLLLYNPDASTRYEVELQLGPTDESHIVRTIEYWDLERRRYPQYEHVGVIIAEEITARFFNVIGLFNGFIPLMAIQLNAIEVGDAMTIVFTTVLDLMPLGLEEEDEADEPADRTYWENRASSAILELADDLLELIKEIDPRVSLKYNKHYIGLARDGIATNFILLHPRRHHILANLRIARSDELTQRLQDSSLTILPYTRWGAYSVHLTPQEVDEQRELLRELVKDAHDSYGR